MNIQKTTESTSSLGDKFRQARENLNLSVEDVAQKLNLRAFVIEAIENNELEQKSIPAIFMKGYVRNYAKLLKLPEQAWSTDIAKIDDTPHHDFTKNTQAKHAVNHHASHNRWIGYLTTLVTLCVLGMTALWWWENYQQSNYERDNLVQSYVANEDKSNKESNSSTDAVVIDTPVQPATISQDTQSPLVITPAPAPVTTTESPQIEHTNTAQEMLQQHTTAEPSTAEQATNTETMPSVAVAGDLQIEVTGANCWISVKDAKRKVLAQKEYKQGEILTFNEGSPYAVIIGAPSNVKITYKGEVYPLKVDGRVAKFKLQ